MDSENEMRYEIGYFEEVKSFVENLSTRDRAKLKSNIDMMRMGNFGFIHTKTLRHTIRELIIKNYHLIYFIDQNVIFFVSAFNKKTNKTPKQEIYNAEMIYKKFIKDK